MKITKTIPLYKPEDLAYMFPSNVGDVITVKTEDDNVVGEGKVIAIDDLRVNVELVVETGEFDDFEDTDFRWEQLEGEEATYTIVVDFIDGNRYAEKAYQHLSELYPLPEWLVYIDRAVDLNAIVIHPAEDVEEEEYEDLLAKMATQVKAIDFPFETIKLILLDEKGNEQELVLA